MDTEIINEQLEDKQQIVTYKYLTHKMNIHPNKAKQLLKDYVSKLTEEKIISITYIIGGTLKENDEFCIVLAYDDHVDTMRRRFKQINFEHIYSIQPIKRLSDINNALYLVDNLSQNQIELPSSIKKKKKEDMLVHKPSEEVAMEIDLPSNKQTQSSNEILSNHKNETIAKDKLEKTEKKKTGLDFFTKNNKSNGIKPEKTEDNIISKKNNSDYFAKFKKSDNFVNPTTDSLSSAENDVNEKDNQMTGNSTKKKVQDSFAEHKEKNKINKVDAKSSNKNVQEQSSSEIHEVNNKKKSNKKTNTGNKIKNTKNIKRKRIQTFDSSEEELDSEEEDKKRSEHVIDVEEEIDFVQPTPPRPTPRENRKKEKQTTTSTFIDNDGFVCTTKEVKIVETICEPTETVGNSSCKEFNDEPIIKKVKSCVPDTTVQVDKKNNKQKQTKSKAANSSQGMKQSSLTSFFSKQ